MKKITDWIIKSSANPQNISMTVKGALIGSIGIIMFFVTQANLPYSVEQVTEMIGYIAQAVGILLTAFGLVRKMYFLLKGK